MTRLRPAEMEPIPGNLARYDAELRRKTGLSLRQLACRANGIQEEEIQAVAGKVTVAAVPMSSGLGVIRGFSHAVAAIVAHLGFRVMVTHQVDVAGMAEAVERGGDILLVADDHRFIALTHGRHPLVDNAGATARGFVAGLEAMKGGVAGESVLILGCGPVGVAGAEALLARGASVTLLDTVRDRARSAFQALGPGGAGGLRVEEEEGPAVFCRYGLIFDATNAGGFMESGHLTPETVLAAPGVPLGLTPEAMAVHGDRVLHDSLEIGTATMAVQAAAEMARSSRPGKAGEP